MSYQSARRQLVSIIEAKVPSDGRIFTDALRFKHLPEGRDGVVCRSRSFWLEANVDGDGGIRGPLVANLALTPLLVAEVTLTVSYRLHERRNVLDEVLAADQRDLAIALLTQSNWGQPASGIESLTNDPIFMRARRVVGPDAVEMKLSFPLTYR